MRVNSRNFHTLFRKVKLSKNHLLNHFREIAEIYSHVFLQIFREINAFLTLHYTALSCYVLVSQNNFQMKVNVEQREFLVLPH